MPATWDETRVLNGRVGEYITIARRKDDTWYVGSMTDWAPRSLDVPLAFLGAGTYEAEIYADAADAGEHPTKVDIRKQPVTSATVLKLELAPGGGTAVRIAAGQ